jgi:hypothetical protein
MYDCAVVLHCVGRGMGSVDGAGSALQHADAAGRVRLAGTFDLFVPARPARNQDGSPRGDDHCVDQPAVPHEIRRYGANLLDGWISIGVSPVTRVTGVTTICRICR